MTCHRRDTSILIGATIPYQEGWDGLDIHGCCAVPMPMMLTEVMLATRQLTTHAHNALIYHDESEVYFQFIDYSYI